MSNDALKTLGVNKKQRTLIVCLEQKHVCLFIHSFSGCWSYKFVNFLVAKKNLKEKRKRFGVLGHLYYLMLASFNGFNFMNGFLQKLANCDTKKRFCAFSLKIALIEPEKLVTTLKVSD